MDESFLKGNPVHCRASIPFKTSVAINEGDKVVVKLSNRSKYMGMIKKTDLRLKDGHHEGFIDIIKT
jgi:hypothetical protein